MKRIKNILPANNQKMMANFFDAFVPESDRGAVLIAAEMMNSCLEEIITLRLLPSGEKQDPLFKSQGPADSFDARIEIAYRIGTIHDLTRQELHLVRRIRNRFAHSIDHCHFEDPEVKSQIMQWRSMIVSDPEGALNSTAKGRDEFVTCASILLGTLQWARKFASRSRITLVDASGVDPNSLYELTNPVDI